MKFVSSLILAFSLVLFNVQLSSAQGCVAVRHVGTCSNTPMGGKLTHKGDWQVSSNYRWFKSFRHFKGYEEQTDRLVQHTEVINNSHALDLGISYTFTDRLSLNAVLPLAYNDRSSLYEHGRKERRYSESMGLGDVRLGVSTWLWSPAHTKANLSLGVGIKLPTGNYNATDTFYNVGVNGAPEVRPVDQSIQLGDGGVGISLDLQGFYTMGTHWMVYGNAYYLSNPRETNGTRTYRETLSAILKNESVCSVADQYLLRTGLAFALPKQGFSFLAGGRFEGIPVRDLIGGSAGFRRPGFVLSAEPSLNYMYKGVNLALNVPVAVLRCRWQSVTDKENEQLTGTPRNGDAAFADYAINVNLAYRFNRK